MENGLIFAATPIRYVTHGSRVTDVQAYAAETVGYENGVLVYRNGYAEPAVIPSEDYESFMVSKRRGH